MEYLFCKHRVEDFDKWYAIFSSHKEVQEKAGLFLIHLLRSLSDPNHIVYLFRVEDRAKAEAFINAPEAAEAGNESGIAGTPEIFFANDNL
jgi:hypothetical protein